MTQQEQRYDSFKAILDDSPSPKPSGLDFNAIQLAAMQTELGIAGVPGAGQTTSDEYFREWLLQRVGNVSTNLSELMFAYARSLDTDVSNWSGLGQIPYRHYTFEDGRTDLPGNFTYTRAGNATYVTPGGLLATAAANGPRFEAQGLLFEGAGSNLLLWSEAFDNAAWTGSATVTADQGIAPDGSSQTADLVNDNSAAAVQEVDQTVAIPADTLARTTSLFSREGSSRYPAQTITYPGGTTKEVLTDLQTGDIKFRPSSGAPLVMGIIGLADSWWRVIVGQPNSNRPSVQLRVQPAWSSNFADEPQNSATGDTLNWGAQLETLPFASSYMPSTGTSGLRNLDSMTVTLASLGIDASTRRLAHAILCDTIGNTGVAQTVWRVDDGTTANMVELALSPTLNPVVRVLNTSANVGSITSTETLTPNVQSQIQVIYDGTALQLTVDGTTQNTTLTGGGVPAGLTQVRFNADISGTAPWYGHLAQFAVDPLNP